jgi:hypothetical protein
MGPDTMEHERLRKLIGYGNAGEPVPQVAPADMKAILALAEDCNKRRQGESAMGINLMQAHCKPGANIAAITYRARIISMLQHIAPEVMEPLVRDKMDAVITAASEIPMEWIGTTVHEGWTFDPNDFVRRVREA